MKTLLLVDDSRAVRLAGCRLAESMGLIPIEAEDGARALDLLRESGGVDVILLDWNMPVMDGLTFLRTLRHDESLRQPIVVMCTTENDMTHVIEAISAGADEYIMKPFTEEIVREKLAQTGIL